MLSDGQKIKLREYGMSCLARGEILQGLFCGKVLCTHIKEELDYLLDLQKTELKDCSFYGPLLKKRLSHLRKYSEHLEKGNNHLTKLIEYESVHSLKLNTRRIH